MASAQILTNGKALYAYNGTEWVPLNTAGNLVNSTRWQYTAVGSETSLSGNDDNGESLIYTPGYEQVYLNGVLLARDADYAATTGTTITGLTALTAGYIVEVIAYNNINVGNTYTQAQIDSKVANTFERWVDTLSASATVLSGLDDNSNTLSYTPGLEQVYVNGILLLPSEYTATSGSSIVLSEAAVASDVIQVYALKNFRVPNTYTILQTDDQFLTKTSASSTYLSQSSASSTYAPVAAGGLVLINTTSFSAASTISLNNVFSATYDNYKIQITLSSTTDADLQIRLRASGTDNSTASSYNNQRLLATSTTVAGIRQTDSYFRSINVRDNDFNALDFTFFRPFLTKPTLMNGLVTYGENSGSGLQFFVGGHNQTVSYDGFTFFGPTITGTVSVYGYKK
jgi:hypothetical protein